MVSVVIVEGKEPVKMTTMAFDKIGVSRIISPEDSVLIKPNYVVARDPSTGITTDSRVIESIIIYLKKLGIKDITVGEGGSGNTERAFDIVGIRDVVSRQRVKLVNLNSDTRVNVKIPQAIRLKEAGISKTALESSCIINVPTLKIHSMALVTLCLKNLMGTILPKSIMHGGLNEKIVDLASIFKNKVKINLVDGLMGAELDEISGYPVQMNLLIGGVDMVAVDTVAASVMGVDPKIVKYLKIAEEKGFGISNLKKIEVIGKRIEEVKKQFKYNLTY